MKSAQIGGGWLTLNRVCNNRCEWCYAKGTDYSNETMSTGLAKKLVKFLASLGANNAVLIGGEPTLHPHLAKIINMFKKTEVKPALISNGIKFADMEFAENIVDTGIKSITFSMKAADRSQYKKLTGNDGYNKVIRGFKNLKKIGIDASFSVTIVNELLLTLPQLLKSLIRVGAKSISVDLASPVIEGGNISVKGIPNPFELGEACVSAYNILKNSGVHYTFYMTIPL